MIICFSGTGNSRAVADELGKQLGHEVVMLTDIAEAPCWDCGDDQIIWVFPVHSWGMPEVVRKMIRRVSLTGHSSGATHHLVATCGDDCGYTDRMWRREIERHGWKTGGAYTVEMPNTYVALPFFDVDKPEVRDRKLAGMPGRVKIIADELRSDHPQTDLIRGAMPGLKTGVIYPFFMKNLIRPAKFKVSADKCISCGRCVKICPLGNVSLENGRNPEWHTACCGCLACYHVCPVKAISYGRFTKGKGQYYFGISTDKKQ